MTQHTFNKYVWFNFVRKQFILSLSSDVGEGGGICYPVAPRDAVLSYTKIMFGLELKHIKALIEVTSWSSRTYHGGGNSPKTT